MRRVDEVDMNDDEGKEPYKVDGRFIIDQASAFVLVAIDEHGEIYIRTVGTEFEVIGLLGAAQMQVFNATKDRDFRARLSSDSKENKYDSFDYDAYKNPTNTERVKNKKEVKTKLEGFFS